MIEILKIRKIYAYLVNNLYAHEQHKFYFIK